MRPGTDFRPEAAKAILLIGDSGSGKTNLAFEFPKPAIIDFGDSNMSNAVARHPNAVFKYGRVDEDDTGKPIAPPDRWKRAADLLRQAGADPDVATIVDDSLSMLQLVLTDYVIAQGSGAEKPLVVGGEKVMTLSLWEPFQRLLRARIVLARSFAKTYLMTCHIKVDENELTTTKEQRPLLSGAMGNKIASLFSDYWMTETAPNSDPKYAPRGVRYFVRTAPTNRVKLKSSFPTMPAEVDASWFGTEAFQTMLRGGAK